LVFGDKSLYLTELPSRKPGCGCEAFALNVDVRRLQIFVASDYLGRV
jgi:hypothetical protein